MKLPVRQAPSNDSPARPKPQQLLSRYHPMLPPRKLRHRLVSLASR
jgi:hypothetical protein